MKIPWRHACPHLALPPHVKQRTLLHLIEPSRTKCFVMITSASAQAARLSVAGAPQSAYSLVIGIIEASVNCSRSLYVGTDCCSSLWIEVDVIADRCPPSHCTALYSDIVERFRCINCQRTCNDDDEVAVLRQGSQGFCPSKPLPWLLKDHKDIRSRRRTIIIAPRSSQGTAQCWDLFMVNSPPGYLLEVVVAVHVF